VINWLTDPDERVVIRKIAKYWNQDVFDRPDGTVLVTNKRLLFFTYPKLVRLSFPLDRIEKLSAIRVMWISPAIRFEVDGRTYVLTFLLNAKAVVRGIELGRSSATSS